MDAVTLADLRRAFDAAREFTVYVGPEADAPRRSVTLRTPTDYQVRVAAMQAGVAGRSDPAGMEILQRTLLERSVVAWAGIRRADILAGDSAELLDFHADAVPLLLDAQPDWFAEPTAQLLARLAERNRQRETSSGN